VVAEAEAAAVAVLAAQDADNLKAMKSIQYNRILAACSLIFLSLMANAQNEVDALRYSNTSVAGTARSLGMGGAFGAIGADLSAFWNNPAGIALNKRMSFEVSLGIQNRTTEAAHLGTSRDNSEGRTVLQSLGLVNVRDSKNNPKIRYSFGIGVANFSNYNQNITIEGNAQNNTLLNVFAAQANGIAYNEVSDAYPFGAGLAWESYLIDPLDTLQNTYIAAENSGRINQRKNLNRSGRHSETTFALGMSIEEKLMIGMTIGVQSVFFRESSTYTERFVDSGYLNNYTYTEDINASGSGLNMRLGAIYRIGEKLRVGATWQSPTNLVIADAYSTSMSSTFVDGAGYSFFSPELLSNYNVRVPARYMASAAFILGKSGVVSADYETTHFGRIKMDTRGLSNDYDFAIENKTIETIYRRIHRVRTGAEIRIADRFRGRAGVIYETSPFVNGAAINNARMTYTTGFGFRKDSFSFDIAAMYSGQNQESYWIYDPSFVEETVITNHLLNIVISAGLRF
jgi:long-subunit fatty acid transport protein